MRLLAGVVAGSRSSATLMGDESLSRRPMERVAVPLREMGAGVETTGGHAPIIVTGGRLVGIDHRTPVPSAQVKGSVLLAGLAADGPTTVREPAPTRDHTERAIEALGGTCQSGPGWVSIEPFQHAGFEASVPGDPSSAAFVLGAAALTRGDVRVDKVGLNPSRLAFVDVLRRMGFEVDTEVTGSELGEPTGSIRLRSGGEMREVRIEDEELPLIIDEVPLLALMASFARGDSWFLGAAELRAKESDRLTAVAAGVRALGGHAADEGDDLVLAGGGLPGGVGSSGGDHRMAMALAVAAVAADGPSIIDGIEAADVSFPGFVEMLRSLGAEVEVEP
jgi:3-phosphoshikimate 1-carboxyvinyltransferase